MIIVVFCFYFYFVGKEWHTTVTMVPCEPPRIADGLTRALDSVRMTSKEGGRSISWQYKWSKILAGQINVHGNMSVLLRMVASSLQEKEQKSELFENAFCGPKLIESHRLGEDLYGNPCVWLWQSCRYIPCLCSLSAKKECVAPLPTSVLTRTNSFSHTQSADEFHTLRTDFDIEKNSNWAQSPRLDDLAEEAITSKFLACFS